MITVKYNTANIRSIDFEGLEKELKSAFPNEKISVGQQLDGTGYVSADSEELEQEVNEFLDEIEHSYLEKI